MKKLTFTFILLALAITCFSQEKKEELKLGLYSSHLDNFEYLSGHVKEIHYKPFHLVGKNGEFVKGKLFTLAESGNVPLRQPWSYYYNELGQMIKMSINDDNGGKWIGIVHHENEKVENIYWLKDDSLLVNWDFIYPTNSNVERLWKMVQNNEVQGKFVYELDKKGNVAKSMAYNNSEVFYTIEYIRNQDGSIKSSNGINKEGKIMWGFDKFTYNSNGLLQSYHHNISNGEKSDHTTSDIEYKFDEKGNWIERKHPGWMVIEREVVYY